MRNTKLISFGEEPAPNESTSQQNTPSVFNFAIDDNDSDWSAVPCRIFTTTMGRNPGDAGGD